jgi:proline iminopeptidase
LATLTANTRDGGPAARHDAGMGTDHAAGQQLTTHGLYTDVRGAAAAPALLFLHGGPGQGCHDFMAIQGDLLGRSVRLIGIDQRGVDRSAPIPEGTTLTVADLVEDFEAVRQALGIERWAVAGQSFGGRLALRYAAAYPQQTSAVVFENPVWDLAASSRAALEPVAAMLAERGKTEAAQAALAAAGRGDQSLDALREAYLAALRALGEDRESFFVPSADTRARLAQVRAAHERPDGSAGDEGSMRHQLALMADPASREPVQHLLAGLQLPLLLIVGGHDPLTSAEQREAFRSAPRGRVLEVPAAGHFVHADDPLHYASAVSEFVRSAAGDLSGPGPGQVPATGW